MLLLQSRDTVDTVQVCTTNFRAAAVVLNSAGY